MAVTRSLEEIQEEERELCRQLGQKRYVEELIKAEIVQLLQKLLALNQEAAELKNVSR